MRDFLFISFLFFSFVSCKTNESERTLVLGYDNEISSSNAPLSSFVKSIDVVPLQNSHSGAILTNPEKVVIDNDHCYVLDNNRLLCYDLNGDFVRFIGERGNGTGEYINIASFVLSNDTIHLLDSFKNSLLIFSSNGNFLYEIKAPDGVLSNVKDASFESDGVFFLSNYIFKGYNDLYTRWNMKSNEVFVVENAKVQTENTKEFVGVHSFCIYGQNIRYVMPFSNLISSTNSPTLEIQTSQKVLTETELKNIHNFGIMTYANHPEWFPGFCNVFETKNYLILTFFNLDYTVVDKRNNTCKRYSYQMNEDSEDFPLHNVLSSNSDFLVGIVNTDEYGNFVSKYAKYIKLKGESQMNANNFLIIYHV